MFNKSFTIAISDIDCELNTRILVKSIYIFFFGIYTSLNLFISEQYDLYTVLN